MLGRTGHALRLDHRRGNQLGDHLIACKRITDMTMMHSEIDAVLAAVAAQGERSIRLRTKTGGIEALRRFASTALSHGSTIDDLEVFREGESLLGMPKPVGNATDVFADLGRGVRHLGIFTGLVRSDEAERALLAALAQAIRSPDAVSAAIRGYGDGSRRQRCLTASHLPELPRDTAASTGCRARRHQRRQR